MSDDGLWLFEVKSSRAHGRAALGSYSQRSINACRPFGFAIASVGFRANRGAADGKLVLIHDVQSYIYAIASPVAAVLACFGELSPWLLASAMVPPAQSVIAWFSNRRQCFGTVGWNRRDVQ
jgi:hypothetical protein